VALFGLNDEVDVFSRLEFELFAFGILPSSESLPLLRDREVVYVNLLPPRPPTPFSLTLAPQRGENSLVAEVRRPGTGLPFEVVYTQQAPPAPPSNFSYEGKSEIIQPGPSKPKPRKLSRFREHMSDAGSRRTRRSASVGEVESPTHSSLGTRDQGKVWYRDETVADEGGETHELS